MRSGLSVEFLFEKLVDIDDIFGVLTTSYISFWRLRLTDEWYGDETGN